jgi:hypothetical protein
MKETMNRISALALFALMLLIMTACGTSSGKFPTGRFVSANDKNLGYIFHEDKTWQYRMYGSDGATGTYQVKGNLWIEQGTEECPFPGTYEWTFDGTNLSFKLSGEDKCDPRREATDGQTFVLVE